MTLHSMDLTNHNHSIRLDYTNTSSLSPFEAAITAYSLTTKTIYCGAYNYQAYACNIYTSDDCIIRNSLFPFQCTFFL